MSSKSRLRRSKKKFISLRDHLALSQTQHPMEPDELACLLEQDSGARTITDLFKYTSSTSSSIATFDHNEVLSPAPPSVNEWEDGDGLAKRVLRGRERLVFCKSTTEVWCGMQVQQQQLSLKLDYEEIMTSWSDRGSLYVDGEGPQAVPELLEDDCVAPNVFVEVGNSSGLRVPEMEVEEGSKRNREERVMRYKAKRQIRLFSKQIRYEVRKLNAEKRPRIKGRFAKRIDDM